MAGGKSSTADMSPTQRMCQDIQRLIDEMPHAQDGNHYGPECIAIHNGAWEVFVTVSSRSLSRSQRRVAGLEASILHALSEGAPLTAKQLARRTGYSYSSHLRSRLTDMARRQLIIRTPDGYRRAND
jgi:hypothetical protein